MPTKEIRKFTKKRLSKKDSSVVPELPVVTESFVIPKPEEPKFEEQKIKKELKEIYENEDGSMPDMKEFQKEKSSSFIKAFIVLLISCVFLGAVAWLGFFVFQPQSGFKEEDVILSVEGQEKFVYGSEVKYRVRYRNDQHVPLSKVVLEVRYPEGFVFENSSQPASVDTNDQWILGSMDGGENGYIDISGRIFGSLNEKKSFRFFLNYIPSNFSSEFQKVTSFNVESVESPVTLDIVGPSEIVPGVSTQFDLTLKKTMETELKNLVLEVTPGNFSIDSSDPAVDTQNQYTWSFDNLDTEKHIKVNFIFNQLESISSTSLNFRLLSVDKQNKQGEKYIILQIQKDFSLSNNSVSANLAMNGSVSELVTQPGETMNTTIAIKNLGQKDIQNISAKLVFEAPSYKNKSIFDWTKIDDTYDGDITGEQINEQTRRGFIYWNSSKVSGFKRLQPGEQTEINIHLPLRTSETIDLTNFSSYRFSAFVEINYEENGIKKSIITNQINAILNSDLNLQVQDEVMNDAGKDKHKITWLLTNNFHELKNIELSADVYGDVSYAQVSLPAGKITYDEKEKKLKWNIDTMPIGVDVLPFVFSLTINKENPTQKNLSSRVNLKATDTITNLEITKVGDEILLQ